MRVSRLSGSLVKVVAGGVQVGGKGQRFDRGGVERVGVAFANLHASVAEEELLGGNDETVLVKGVAWDKEVGDAGFVFERNETVPFSGAGALAADDLAGTGDVHAVGDGGEVDRPEGRVSEQWAGGRSDEGIAGSVHCLLFTVYCMRQRRMGCGPVVCP